MPRSVGASIENNFSGGLNTDQGSLSFPENAVVDSDNMHFSFTGDTFRRLGINAELNYSTNVAATANNVIVSYLWQSVNDSGGINFVVVQVGSSLIFYQVIPNQSLSSGFMSTSVDLTAFAIDSSNIGGNPCQFVSGNGFLFVCHRNVQPGYITFNPILRTFTYNIIPIQIRDVKGVPDYGWGNSGLPLNFAPATLTSPHYYNLVNQGWTLTYINEWFTAIGSYPPNTVPWWLFKDTNGVFNPATTFQNLDEVGLQQAPKGYFFLDPFYMDRSSALGTAFESVVTSNPERPQTCAFFAGRIFFGGVDSVGFGNQIWFSQVIQTVDDFRKCYQDNSPTSETQFDTLASDGGTIQIQDAGRIIKLLSLQSSLVAFCTNGVWVISGSVGTGFSATDYSIRKISGVRSVSASSFVTVLGFPVWWTQDGIYALEANSTIGTLSVVSLTIQKVNNFFAKQVSLAAKTTAVGDYNDVTKEIIWVYRQAPIVSFHDAYVYDSALVFNTLTKSFSTWSLPITGGAFINGIVAVQGTSASLTADNVILSDGSIVVDSGAANVVVNVTANQQLPTTFKYLLNIPGTTTLTFGEESDSTYVDFRFVDGIGLIFSSYFLTGFKVHGDAQKKFQSNYLYVFCDNSVPSSLYVQGVWDYNTNSSTGRFSSAQKLNYGGTASNVYKRMKIRGQGVSLQYLFTAQDNQPMDVIGWSTFETANASV